MDSFGQADSSTSGNALLSHDSTLGESCAGGQTASATSLLGLPVELQKTILEYLTTNADKKNACLTCKEMQVLVRPLLYKDMEIDVERLDRAFLSTLKEDHAGLSHVRTMRIRSLGPWQSGSKSSDETPLQANIICRLLHTLPKHSLTRFEYDKIYICEKKKPPNMRLRIPNSSFIGAGLLFTLRLRQANVCNYQLFSGLNGVVYSAHLDWDMIAPAVDELAHVTCLQIYFELDDYDQIDRAGLILARSPALRYLDIELEDCDSDEFNTCCDSGARIIQGAFRSHIETGQTARLKSLRITSMCLQLVSELLTTVLELEDLKHLQLVRCADIDQFLRRLEPLGLHLSSLCIDESSQELTGDITVRDFMHSLDPLKRLTLRLSDIGRSGEESLRSHYASLESLCVEDDPEEEPIIPMLKHAPNLEQLALSGFRFENGWLPNGPAEFDDLQDLSDTLKPLQSLRLLKLTTYCTSLGGTATPTQMLCMPLVLRTVREAAEEIFGWNLPNLTAVIFVIEGERDHLLANNRFAFLRSKQLDPNGVMRSSVVPVESHMVKHHVPCAGILEPDKFVFA